MDWHQTLTNYKALFLRVWQLIIRPRTAWEEVSAEPSGRDVAMTFVFPLICFCGLATLIGRVVRDGFADGNFMRAFTDTCVVCFVLMGTYYLGAWGINMLRIRYLKHDDDMPLTYRFMAYSMSLSFALAGACIALGSTLQALGKSVYSMITSFIRQLVVLIPAAFFLARYGVATGNSNLVWWSYPVAEVAALAVTVIFYVHVYKTVISKIPRDGTPSGSEN